MGRRKDDVNGDDDADDDDDDVEDDDDDDDDDDVKGQEPMEGCISVLVILFYIPAQNARLPILIDCESFVHSAIGSRF